MNTRFSSPKYHVLWITGALFLFLINSSSLLGNITGTPKVAYGIVRDSYGNFPASGDLTFNAYITIRTGEVLTKASLGCGYNAGTGQWFVECGNFPTPWVIGNTLKVDLTDIGAGPGGNLTETNSIQGVLDPAGSQQFGDATLPVQMTSITAVSSKERGVTLVWRTESEVDCAGFNIWKSESEGSDYSKITTALLPGRGNSSSAYEYSFTDRNVVRSGLYWYKIEEVSTIGESEFFGPISVNGIASIPTRFGLSQNYPNPFNPSTTIDYQLPADSRVSIRVYDLMGKEAAVLVDQKKEAGFYSVRWDGRNSQGNPVSSGIYFVKIQADDFSAVRKLSVVR
jgi:hypothetical protein